jgi:predicted metal-dependent HD superfamily phosphohydrolase
MATQHFKTEPKTQDEKVIHDLDLAILGSDPEEYEKYEKLIRKEYSFVEDKVFAQGRLQVLEQFVKKNGSETDHKKTLYLTQYFQDHYEKKAIDNILREMDNIRKSFPTPE